MQKKPIIEKIILKDCPELVNEVIEIHDFIDKLIEIKNKCFEKGYWNIKVEIETGYDGGWTNLTGNREETEEEMERRILKEGISLAKKKEKELKELAKAKETYETIKKRIENGTWIDDNAD